MLVVVLLAAAMAHKRIDFYVQNNGCLVDNNKFL